MMFFCFIVLASLGIFVGTTVVFNAFTDFAMIHVYPIAAVVSGVIAYLISRASQGKGVSDSFVFAIIWILNFIIFFVGWLACLCSVAYGGEV